MAKKPSYKDTPQYQALSTWEKQLADLQYQVSTKSSEYTKQQLKDALAAAKKDSDPYMRGIIRMAEEDVSLAIAQETGDYESHLKTLEQNIKETEEDLANNREFMTLEHQRSMAQQLRDYKRSSGQMKMRIAEQGLGDSTFGKQEQTYAEQTQEGIVEGQTARFEKGIRDLEVGAQRQISRTQQGIEDLTRTHQNRVSQIGLGAERTLGSERASSLVGGYEAVGGVGGTLEEQRVQDINQRQQAYLGDLRQESLRF